MKAFTTNKASGLIVSVPHDAKDISIEKEDMYYKAEIWNLGAVGHLKKLPPGNWHILGLSHELTEQEKGRIVEEFENGLFEDYSGEEYNERIDLYPSFKLTVSESFKSLLLSLGLDPKENYAILIHDKK